MTILKRMVLFAVLVGSLSTLGAGAARAQMMEIVFRDAMWGAGIGALVGLGQVLLFDNPEDELSRITRSAAFGIFVGVGIGFAEGSGAFASYDAQRKELVVGLPLPIYDPKFNGFRIDLLQAKF